MYTHARQFPHLAEMDDGAIRDLIRRGMRRRPTLIRVMQFRNAAIMLAMLTAATLLPRFGGYKLGEALGLAGITATLFVLGWNIVWINTVVFRLTTTQIAIDRENQ